MNSFESNILNHTQTHEDSPVSLDELHHFYEENSVSIPEELLNRGNWEKRVYETEPENASRVLIEFKQFIENRIQATSMLRTRQHWHADISPSTKQEITENVRHLIEKNLQQELLGEGRSGEIYVDHVSENFCMKLIHDKGPFLGFHNDLLTECLIQDRIWQEVHHPNVSTPRPYYCEDGAEGILLMERVHGSNLEEIVNDQKKALRFKSLLGTNRATHIANLQSFLSQIHNLGILHGDFQLRNIMLDQNLRWFIIDFGASQYEFNLPTDPVEKEMGNQVDRFRVKQDSEMAKISAFVNLVFAAVSKAHE